MMCLVWAVGLALFPASALPEAATVPPARVSLDAPGCVTLNIGASLTLTPALSPADATTAFTWRSSRRCVATVSGGVVRAKKAGTTTVTVTTSNGRKASVKIRVVDPLKPVSVRLDRTGTVRMPLGGSLTLSATLYPETARSRLRWKSTRKRVAAVSGGVVRARKTGTAVITVATRNNKKARVKIVVYDPKKPAAVALDRTGTLKLRVGDVLQLTATLRPETARSRLKWKSSNKRVAVVTADGLVGGVAPGKATITVTTRNKKKAKVKIEVVKGDPQSPETPTVDDPTDPVVGPQPDPKTGVDSPAIVTPEGYNLPYVIYACKNSHTIAILARDESGAWNRVVRLYPAGMGRNNATDVGTFTLSRKERWHMWGTGFSPFANKLSVGIFLHGPIYKSKSHNTILPSYYNVIGTDCSSGCIRTVCGCAAWVYYNCPVGTMVIVAQDSRFSTPRPAKIKATATRDPTDPGDSPEIFVVGFSTQPDVLTLTPGAFQYLTPVGIQPYNASTKSFRFASSDENVATVSPAGCVVAVQPGSAFIAVTADDDYGHTVNIPVIVSGTLCAAGSLDGGEGTEDQDGLSLEETAPDGGEDAGLSCVAEPVGEETPEITMIDPELQAIQ